MDSKQIQQRDVLDCLGPKALREWRTGFKKHTLHLRTKPDVNIVLRAKKKPQETMAAGSVEKIAGGFNKKHNIELNGVWTSEDIAQEAYLAFYEGYNITGRLKRVWFSELRGQKGAKPPSDDKQNERECKKLAIEKGKATLKRRAKQKGLAIALDYDVKPFLDWWRKDWDKHRERQWYSNPFKTREQEADFKINMAFLRARANPPLTFNAKRTPFIDKDEKQDEGAEKQYALPEVDRPMVIEGGEVVPFKIRSSEVEPVDPDKTEPLKEVAEEDFSSTEEGQAEGGTAFADMGYEWNDNAGYVRDDV
jgi:hypothetical protein